MGYKVSLVIRVDYRGPGLGCCSSLCFVLPITMPGPQNSVEDAGGACLATPHGGCPGQGLIGQQGLLTGGECLIY